MSRNTNINTIVLTNNFKNYLMFILILIIILVCSNLTFVSSQFILTIDLHLVVGLESGCHDSLAYQTLIPVSVLQNYLRLVSSLSY